MRVQSLRRIRCEPFSLFLFSLVAPFNVLCFDICPSFILYFFNEERHLFLIE